MTIPANFDEFIAKLHWCLVEEEGVVKVTPAARSNHPDWLRPLLEFVHRRSKPDEYIMECVWLICSEHLAAMEEKHEMREAALVDAMTDGMTACQAAEEITEDDADFYVSTKDAAGEYSRINIATPSLIRRWLMWQDGIHWPLLDDALLSNTKPRFEALIESAMELHCEYVGHRIEEFYEQVLTAAAPSETAEKK